MSELYIGLMSGTSVDGIDAGLVDFSDGKIQLVAFHYQPFSAELRQKIHKLSQANQPVLLTDYGSLDSQIGRLFGETTLTLLSNAQIPASAIKAVGSHGQTVYHAPETGNGFSLQIGDPNRIAEITGLTTVADFRRRDIAVGGQGAPLVPAFHQAVFSDAAQARVIVNIGGIANITVLNDKPVIGFDTGPGNGLMDLWCQKHCNQPYDCNGDWAAKGTPHTALLDTLKDDDYFRVAPPKSTGKEYFSPAWLQQKLSLFPNLEPEDIQATLCQFSADTIADAIRQYAPNTLQTLICGGGAHNRQLMKLLRKSLDMSVTSTAEWGIAPDHVEAIAFAWLARQTLNNLPGNLCSVTGAATPVVLGGIYPGKNGLS
ncbi:anhydro-N-acetylmuramic acid kinase [Methylomonas sp. EbB]|uniref:Anhydro-N-acetylmuramic acid kinase n=1 Tax=Methylomonas fluvii TaxID=1854564 RepID=A0ABR9DFN5_9GAMM|nr:anhydro-N-acetylmuramic acid kinase [Methylomonas fluvii]